MNAPAPVTKTFEPQGNLQQFRLEKLVEFSCNECGKSKKSKLVVIKNGDWAVMVCNGCYGEAISKGQ